MRFARVVSVGWLGLFIAQAGFAYHGSYQGNSAGSAIPSCPAYRLKDQNGGNPGSLGINNVSVLAWKQSTPNQYTDRGHVSGTIVAVFPDRTGHLHFSLQIGPNDTDTVEIIYNQDFGTAPNPQVGMTVEACGDYITSTAQSDGPNGIVYPASPDGAIIHWVHIAPSSSAHTSGFLVMGGQLVGQDLTNAGSNPSDGYFNHEYAPGTDLNAR